MKKDTIAISIGDLNGIGIEIALRSHVEVSKIIDPLYCISEEMLDKACTKLNLDLPSDFHCVPVKGSFEIEEGKICKKSGLYSYKSFKKAIKLCEKKIAKALVTLPIHKEAWFEAGIEYKGHTDMLRDWFKQDAIMMLGCDKLYVALYTEHIPLKEVAENIKTKKITNFLLDLARDIQANKIAVLGLNPHAGDGGVLGNEERKIAKAISKANETLGKELFSGPFVPDTAFTKPMRQEYQHYVAMYHDQGLIPLKALHFEESINISLSLPIIRTSVDHGTAFDIAYKDEFPSSISYLNAIKAAVKYIKKKGL
ncbi:MAG: 4-hydroxythreonine-4-phosphate dehydrogenase PdxA [Arcobacter sp.]|nr:MAG: 4-hydroxythreonine-4-phosphate dehydrogenase PdxA [Arcobacter sp.]